MATKTRSEVPILPPIKGPIKPLSRGLVANEHALVPRPRHGADEDIESRVCMLEQAHKMLLEELVNTQARSHTWFNQHENECFEEMGGVRNSLGVNSTTLSHLLNQVSEAEKRIFHMQSQLDQMGGMLQRTRNENMSFQRDAEDGVTRQFKELEEKLTSCEERLLMLQKEGDNQKKLLSHQMSDMSTSLSSQGRSGARAIKDLQRSLKEVEHAVHILAGSMSQVSGISTHLEVSQLDTTHRIQSRCDEMWSLMSDLEVRLSAADTQRKRQDSWLKESFNGLQEELAKLSTNNSSSLKAVMSDVKRLEERLTAIERLCAEMEGSREIWKEERRTLGDELMRGVNEKLERFGGMTEKGEWAEAAELKEINREVNQYKTAFEENKKFVQKNLSVLTKSLSLLEGESRVSKRELTRVMEAEIKTRREEVLVLQKQCSSLLESFSNTSESLKLSLSALEKRASQTHSECTDAIRRSQDQWKEAYKHLLTDIGTRLSSLHIRKQEQDSMEQRIKSTMEQFESLTTRLTHLEENKQFQELKDSTALMLQKVDIKATENSSQLHGLAKSVQETQVKLASQIQSESTRRFQEVLEVRNELAWIHSRLPQYPTITSTAPPSFATPKYQHKLSERVSSHEHHQVTSPTPEPQSPHSSPSVAHKWRRSRRGRGTRQVMYAQEPTETMGTFTSAAPTPVELRKILVNEGQGYQNKSEDYLDEDDSNARQDEEEQYERTGQNEEEVQKRDEKLQYNEEFENEGGDSLYHEEEVEFHLRGDVSQFEEFGKEEEEGGHDLSRYEMEEFDEENASLDRDDKTDGREEVDNARQLPVQPSTTSVFVKEQSSQDLLGGDCWMNEWGVYQALRLLQIKNKLMAPVYRLREQNPPQ